MKISKIRSLAIAVVAGLFAVSMAALAQPGRHGAPHRGPNGGPRGGGLHDTTQAPRARGPLGHLELTDAQKEQIQAIHEQFRAEHADELAQIQALHEQLREQREAGDAEGVRATMAEIKALHETLKADQEALGEQISAVLTDEQRAQLEEMRARHEDRGPREREGRGRGRGHGPGPTVE